MTGLARRSLAEAAVSPAKFIPNLLVPAYFRQAWPSVPPRGAGVDGYSDPTGATGNSNFAFFNALSPMVAAYHIKGAGQTILAPFEDAAAGYLLAGLDDAASEGVEYVPGGKNTAFNPFANTIGSSTARYRGNKFLRLRFELETVANGAECAVGFRKAEAFQANLDDYDELACLNLQAGDVNIETILNNAATVTTDTGIDVADATETTLEVRMKGREARFFINGLERNNSFRFDAGEVIVPFIFFLQGGGGGSEFRWYELEVGDVEDDDESLQF